MLHELPSNVRPNLNGLLWQLSFCSSFLPLSGTVVDQIRYPSVMQAPDSTPEECPICADVAIPLVREAFFDARKSDCLCPDLSYC